MAQGAGRRATRRSRCTKVRYPKFSRERPPEIGVTLPTRKLGSHKSPQQWQNQLAQRGWTLELIDEAIVSGSAIQRPITLIRETRLHGMSAGGPASRWLSMINPEKSYMSVPQDTDTEVVVYVRLLDEGTEVRRQRRATACRH